MSLHNDDSKYENTPLLTAILDEQFESVKSLLQQSCNHETVNTPSFDGWHVLHLLASSDNRDNIDVVRLVLSIDSIVTDARLSDLSTPLHIAVCRQRDDICKLLIEHNPALVHARDIYHMTPLHVAVSSLNEDIIRLLIEKGQADIDAISNFGTPLQLAEMLSGSEHIIPMLVTDTEQ